MRPPWVKISQCAGARLLGVDRHHDALAAEFSRRLADDFAVGDGGGHDRDFVGAGEKQRADVVERAHAAADRERHEAGFRRALDDIEDDRAVLVARGDVEKAQFVGAGRVIGDRALDRIAGIAQIDEMHALDDAAVLDVEAGNDAAFKHRRRSRRRRFLSCQSFRLSNQRQRLRRVEPPIVERPPGDRAFELGAVRHQQTLDIGERGETAGGDHRNAQSIGERQGRLDVEALEHAVAGNVGIDDRGDARILESFAEFGGGDFRACRPALDRDLAVRARRSRPRCGRDKAAPRAGREPDRGPPPFR